MEALYEERRSKTYICYTCIYVTFINMSHMVIPKEDALFKTRPKPKVNVQLCWISLFSKPTSYLDKTTVSGLSYGLGVNGEKK